MRNLLELGALFGEIAHEVERRTDQEMLEPVCKILVGDAKDAIGTYRYGWPPLGPAAVAKHGDTPLLDVGTLQASIEYKMGHFEAWFGSSDPVAAWQEFGTSRGIPPRPFIYGALVATTDQINAHLGNSLKIAMMRR